jgi:hypothetical protein
MNDWLKLAWYIYAMVASVNFVLLLLRLDRLPGPSPFGTRQCRQLYINMIVDSALWPALWAGAIEFEDPRH